jgi:AcrR family transcriptional regulator
MKIKDNTVNIKPKGRAIPAAPKAKSIEPKPRRSEKKETEASKSYHHGDLRATLIDTSFKLLEDRQGEALGLRELAREVGVSPTAIYRHFPDKAALMSALAHEGLERLAEAQFRASLKTKGGLDALMASGLTYVRFAAENPALFRLIFSYVAPISPLEGAIEEVSSAMRGLRQGIHASMPRHFSEDEKKATTLLAWSLVHGLAELLLNGHIAKDWKLIEMAIGGLARAYRPLP